MNGGSSSEKASGTCDGIGFSRESTCCKDHGYQKCPYPNGCFDFNKCQTSGIYQQMTELKLTIEEVSQQDQGK